MNLKPDINEQLSSLKELEKISGTTPEVDRFIREGSENLQTKILAKQKLTKKDFEFMDEVRAWLSLSQRSRKNYPSIESMRRLPEYLEGKKRGIGPGQWLGLLHLAKMKVALDKPKWIDSTFQFPGGGKIVAENDLNFGHMAELKWLPEGLIAKGDLNMTECPLVRTLPKGLRVDGELILFKCASLEKLPEELIVGKGLHIGGCPKLTSLPRDLQIGKNLYFSRDANPNVKKDAAKLRAERRIRGNIIYSK